ncbi:MAG TPA: hypothetical protein DD405_07335 [Desulfobacteraceae bacterium]|nr:hypothetical protein [Desulfobacteraceae bacterium]
MTETSKIISFGNGIKCEIKRDGQEDRETSNLVKVKATLFIPVATTKNNIHAKIDEKFRWRHKIRVIEEDLIPMWGDVISGDKTEHRQKTKIFTGKKWTVTFQKAEKYLRSEVAKIDEAEKVRVQALADAEL